ncbi:unnamed protein product [Cylicocyclus nassatus]|uniref:Potassium channel domain-containing protein n=1 Tax=Cylicocyclus nassatus TaxID=53992 RepID=A0AA36DK90_CYLNA|nr:unnamed protein product [Cylicocyclus nassatus]
MFHLYRRLKWVYQKFHLSTWVPFVALVSYTIFGAVLFRFFEMENDRRARELYRNRTEYAMNQVVERMLEVRCHDVQLREADHDYQVQHARDALTWFLVELNLTEVITEKTNDTPWTWLGSMFYAGQLYTTIGYGYPITRTPAGRVASIFYILFGIPIFLIILKDIGRLMSRGFRKLYKRLRGSQQKIAQSRTLRLLSQPFMNLSPSDQENLKEKAKDVELGPEEQNKVNAKLYAENAFPIPIALAILFIWILFSSGLFCLWESRWGYLTSVYFFFVSISTVGLGDIVFLNPDMMIFMFLLILIGLALLSMCFNLIQAALERLLDRLLEEYIEEIEKMAEIVAQDEYMEEEVGPLEFRMTGNLLALPMKKVTKETGLLAEAKSWVAGRIANNLLASRLGPHDSDSEEEHEEEELQRAKEEEAPHVMVSAQSSQPFQTRMSSISTATPSIRSSHHNLNLNRYHFRYGKRMLDVVRTLEKIKPQKDDFRSLMFSKFLQNNRLTRIVEDLPPPAVKKMATTCCQTDDAPRPRKFYQRQLRELSSSSHSTSPSRSLHYDDESLMSSAYCDIYFDYSADAPPSAQHSSFSVMKMEDDEPLLPSKLMQSSRLWRTPPKLNIQPLSLLKELSPPFNAIANNLSVKSPSYTSLREIMHDAHTPIDEPFDHVRSLCGLLPSDFDTRSISSRSTMVDSGYDKSHHEDTLKQILSPSPAPAGYTALE